MNTMHLFVVSVVAWAIMASGAETVKEVSRDEKLAAARKEMLGAIPPTQPGAFEAKKNVDAEYVYEVTSAKPVIEGDAIALESDTIVKGLTVARLEGVVGDLPDDVRNTQLYWKLGNIEPGKYWIGVWYDSGDSKFEAAQPKMIVVPTYLNGRMVQMGTHGKPVQVAPGVFFAEAQSAEEVELNPGDEIAVGRTNRGLVLRLILRQKAPERGPFRMPTNFGGNQWNPYTALGLNVDAVFMGSDGKALPRNMGQNSMEREAKDRAAVMDKEGMVTVDFVFCNPLPIELKVAFENVVRAYYFEVAVQDKGEVTIPAHGRIVRPLRFRWDESEPAYIAFMNLSVVNPPSISASRKDGGLGWPENEVYSFFPGHRHALPWPDPYRYRNLRRVSLAKTRLGSRYDISLEGRNTWERALTTELEPTMPPPAGLEFKPADMPFREKIADRVPHPHGIYMRRSFTLPEDLSGNSYRLKLDKVQSEATAYVNGVKVGNVRGCTTPLVCDITHAVKPGTNEVILIVRDIISLMNQAYVNKEKPQANVDYLDAPCLHGAQYLEVWGAGVESAPAVSTEDVFAITSVRKKAITARVTLGNRKPKEIKVKVKTTVLDEGKPVLDLGETELALAPDSVRTFELEKSWANPRLWGPLDPHLYALAVEITDSQTGARLDFFRQRFGFRESWIDGPYIMFNGYRIRPKGNNTIKRLDPEGEHCLRRFFAGGDTSDEAGIPGYMMVTGVHNTMSQHNAESRNFWDSAEKNALLAMKKWQNRPSVTAWDISNEWLFFAIHVVNDIKVPARNFKKLSDALRAYDPTRWTLANGDVDLWGLLDNQSFHYMTPYQAPGGSDMRGHSAYFPDMEFWRPLNRHYRPNEEFPLSPFLDYYTLQRDKKVIMDNEFLWKVGNLMPPGPSEWIGEDDVISPAVDDASGPMAWIWKTKLDAHRDLGASPINTYAYHAGVVRGAYLDQTFIIPENQRRAFSGRTETRRYTLLNGRFDSREVIFSWKLQAPDGKVIQHGDFNYTMPSGGDERGEFSFKVPEVSQPTHYTLAASLVSNGRFISREEWDIEVWPDKPIAAGELKRNIVLFDPAGKTAKVLEQATVNFDRMDSLGMPSGDPSGTLLVIGEDSLDDKNAPQTAKLTAFVEKGGHLLVLRQSIAPRNLPVRTSLMPQHWASQTFVRTGLHPVLKGLNDMDLHFWQTDRSVGQGAYVKPATGNFIALVDSGGMSGLESVQLMELYRGKGVYMLCQIPVAGKYDVEPMARELLVRIINYVAGKDTFAKPEKSVVVAADEASPVLRSLKDFGVTHQVLPEGASWDGQLPLIADSKFLRKTDPGIRKSIAKSVRDGGTLVISGSEPEDQAWLTEMAGVDVSVMVPPYRFWEGRGYRCGWSPLTAGISHIDLCWKRLSGGEYGGRDMEMPENTIEPLQDYSVKAETGKELIFPGTLVELPLGKGKVILDQRRWWTQHQDLFNQTGRNLSALLTGLGVQIAAAEPPPEMKAEVFFRPLDIAPYANRGFVDELAQDGKGGWSDQGPKCDLRAFPTGLQLFQGVPFIIGKEPKTCIVLASKNRAGFDSMPKEAGIPIGYKVEGLYILHGAAYCGGEVARYRMEFEDGRTVEIPVVSGENINDWAGPGPLPREKGTQSVVAWTGKNAVFPKIGIYRMLWVNPYPDVLLKQVVFLSPKLEGVPGLIGITAAVGRENLKPTTKNVAKSEDLLKQGRAAADVNKLDDALRLIREALAANLANGDAYRLLLDTAERTHDEEKIMDAAWRWCLSGPPAPAPWNRFGDILEKRKDFRGALEAYKESLEIEWNQPPTMNARKRMEDALAK